MKHTKGKAEVGINQYRNSTHVEYENGDSICKMESDIMLEDLQNAELIAECFNVTNECGLTPRQLLEQRNELLDVIKELQSNYTKGGAITGHLYNICEETLKKCNVGN